MIKRCAIVSLLLLAFTLVLAHSIIPHHHHDVAVETTSENHEHRNENALEHSFENYLHSGASYDYFIKNDFTFDKLQVVTDCDFIYLNFDFRSKIVIDVTKSAYRIFKTNTIHPVFLYSKGLRGPPLV